MEAPQMAALAPTAFFDSSKSAIDARMIPNSASDTRAYHT